MFPPFIFLCQNTLNFWQTIKMLQFCQFLKDEYLVLDQLLKECKRWHLQTCTHQKCITFRGNYPNTHLIFVGQIKTIAQLMDSQICTLQMQIYYTNFDPQIPMHHLLFLKYKDAEIVKWKASAFLHFFCLGEYFYHFSEVYGNLTNRKLKGSILSSCSQRGKQTLKIHKGASTSLKLGVNQN